MVGWAASALALSVIAPASAFAPAAAAQACASLPAEEEAVMLLQHDATSFKSAKAKTADRILQPDTLAGNATEVPAAMPPGTFSAAFAEYVAMTLFVVIGCGTAMGVAKETGSAWILQVSLAFGFAITSLAYAIGAYSGGQINCAVTLGLVLVGHISIGQGILNFIAQMLGSLTGAYILCGIFPQEQDKTGGLACNAVSEGFKSWNAFAGELMMTFLLVFVVLETAVNPNSEGNRALACVAIGFAVFLAHTVLIPIDGCSINPTRSFGPAFVARQRYGKEDAFRNMGVFWCAPLTGAALAAAAYGILRAC